MDDKLEGWLRDWPMPEPEALDAPIRRVEMAAIEALLREDDIPASRPPRFYRAVARRLLGEVYRLQEILQGRDAYIAHLERENPPDA